MREFDTGATRDTDEGKLDYEGFLSPLVVQRYAEYMHKHRIQADGNLRDADNWQKGMPRDVYMKSLWRHFMDLWLIHRGRGDKAVSSDVEDVLCAILFNVMGYLFSVLDRQAPAQPIPFPDSGWDRYPSSDTMVAVRLEDLTKVLSESEGFVGGKDNAEFTRLAEAAGCA